MELNRFIFASPKPTYTISNLSNLILIPKTPSHPNPPSKKPSLDFSHRRIHSHEIQLEDINGFPSNSYINYTAKIPPSPTTSLSFNFNHITKTKEIMIPALYFQFSLGSNKILLYFHANAEDLGMISFNMFQISQILKVNLLAIEYPGYGIYKGDPMSSELNSDAEIVYNFIINNLNFKPKDIIVVGRSIGSGPACHLASDNEISCVILISPFKSIKTVVKSVFGLFAAFLVADRFKNIDLIKKIKSPILFIHGKKDNLVPMEHSIEMSEVCVNYNKKFEINLIEQMGHNDACILRDICLPIMRFLRGMALNIKNDSKYLRFLPEKESFNVGVLANNKRRNSLIKMFLEKN